MSATETKAGRPAGNHDGLRRRPGRAAALAAIALAVLCAAAACGSASPAPGRAKPSASQSAAATPTDSSPSGGSSGGGGGSGAGSDGSGNSSGSGAINVSFTREPADPTVQPDGSYMDFTVSVFNPQNTTYHDVAVVIGISSCTCMPNEPAEAAAVVGGTLQLQDSSGAWQNVTYRPEGGGPLYLAPASVPAFNLAPNATVSFNFRISVTGQGATGPQKVIGNGQFTIDAQMSQLPGPTQPTGQINNASTTVQFLDQA